MCTIRVSYSNIFDCRRIAAAAPFVSRFWDGIIYLPIIPNQVYEYQYQSTVGTRVHSTFIDVHIRGYSAGTATRSTSIRSCVCETLYRQQLDSVYFRSFAYRMRFTRCVVYSRVSSVECRTRPTRATATATATAAYSRSSGRPTNEKLDPGLSDPRRLGGRKVRHTTYVFRIRIYLRAKLRVRNKRN